MVLELSWRFSQELGSRPLLSVRCILKPGHSERGKGRLTIGGVHTPNLPQLLHGSIAPNSRNKLAGVAVISDIVSSIDPFGSAKMLREVIDSFKRSRDTKKDTAAIFSPSWQATTRVDGLIEGVMALMGVIKKETPLIHQVSTSRM
jgi:thiamine-phosphate diphosphorylase/hydroxyethylthiazole kinase